ncbi:MAG: hypothetical protein IJO95_00855 [Clostridia bacterium]|nr:hypothetical protein [Clostridia bacterium]
MDYIICTEAFILKLKLSIFEDDIHLSSNTIMDVFVKSNGFSGCSTMNINIKDFAKFSSNLNGIYETLTGEARIEEPYGMHMYISFNGDGQGHITVKGYLHSGDRIGNEHSLEFENCIDQTCLKDFCQSLHTSYSKYVR